MDEGGDKNIKFFHNVIKSRKHYNRIRKVCDQQGNWFEGDSVAGQFVSHFERFLGNNGDTASIDNAEELFVSKLTKMDAKDMVRTVTSKQIKDVIFSMDDSKAPGPVGIQHCFLRRVGMQSEMMCVKLSKSFLIQVSCQEK